MRLLILFLVLVNLNLHAQQNILGKVVNNKKYAMEGASVLLLAIKDSSRIGATVTDKSGEFKLANVQVGDYIMSISSMGFEEYFQRISVMKNMPVQEFILQNKVNDLKQVTVVSKRTVFEQKPDRLVMNVDNTITNAGASAIEVINKIPGVIIQNDKITLGGKTDLLIMIDGKTSPYVNIAEVLKNISSVNISKIEIITVPGAKFDAEGSAIINIVLKKMIVNGTNGNFSFSSGAGIYNNSKENFDRNFYRYTPSINFNHRNNKLNIYGSYSFNHRNWFEYNGFDRYIDTNVFIQKNISYRNTNSHTYRLGIDIYADSNNIFGVLVKGFNNAGSTQMINETHQYLASDNSFLNSFVTLNNINLSRNDFSADFNWKHHFHTPGKEYNVDFEYASFDIKNSSSIINNFYSAAKTNYHQYTDNPIQFFVIKSDLIQPLKNNFKMETGAKFSYAVINNDLNFSVNGLNDTSRSTNFLYKETINASYTTISKNWNNWMFSAGIRAEQTIVSGNSGGNEVLNRNYWQLFPSLIVKRNLKNDISTKLEYSRRVQRPNYQQQNPFILVLDSLTFTEGNPALKPELINTFKYTIDYKNLPVFSISYTNTTDVIFNDAPKQKGNQTYTTPENLGRFDNFNIELNFPINIGKKITGFGGNQLVFKHYRTDYLNAIFDDHKWNWITYGQINYKPSDSWNIEASGYYTTAFLNEFYHLNHQGTLGFAVQKTMLNKRGKISLNITDVLFSEKFLGSISYQNINVKFNQFQDSRNIRVSFVYSFGNQSVKAVRDRKTAALDENNRVKSQ